MGRAAVTGARVVDRSGERWVKEGLGCGMHHDSLLKGEILEQI